MEKERIWKLNMVLWSIVLIVSIVGIALWVNKFLAMGEGDWLPIFLFICSGFSSVMWIVLYRKEKKKGTKK